MAKLILEVETDASGGIRNLKQFGEAAETAGKKTSMLDNVLQGIGVGVGLAAFEGLVVAVRGLVGGLDDLIDRGGRAASIQAGFSSIVADSANVLEEARAATKGLISDVDLMTNANRAALLGLDTTAEGFAELANAAVTLGRAMGVDATQSISDLVQGLGKGEVELLDNLGLAVKAEDAYRKYADALGITSAALTLEQKQQALVNDALGKARDRVEQLGEIQLTLSERITQGTTTLGNWADRLGVAIVQSPVLRGFLVELGDAFEDAFGGDSTSMIELVVSLLEQAAFVVLDLGRAGIESARGLLNAWAAVPHLLREVQLWFLQLADDLTQVEIRARQFQADALLGLDQDANDRVRQVREGAVELKADIAELQRQIADGAVSEFDDQLGGLVMKLDDMRDSIVNGATPALEAQNDSLRETADAAEDAGRALGKLIDLPVNEFFSGGGSATTGIMGLLQANPAAQLGVTPLQTNGVFSGMNPDDLVPTVRLQEATRATTDWSAALEDLNNAFTLFGDPGRKLGELAAGIASIMTSLETAQGGGTLGRIVGGLGIAGAGVNILGGLASSLFGGGEEAEVNDIRDEFFAGFEDGFVGLQRQLEGLTDQDLVRRIFDAETVEDFNAAVGEAMGLLDTQAAAQERLNEAVQRHGIESSEIPGRQAEEVEAMAGQLIGDFEILKGAGVDLNTILERMGPSFNDFVQQALEAGVAIPEAMRGPIQSLIEMGLLTDASGNPFASLEESGLQFTETLTEGLGRVIESIDRLVAALRGVPPVTIPVGFDAGALPSPRDFDPSSRPGFAEGGFVPATPGGQVVRVAEGGEGEFIVPESLKGLVGSTSVTVNMSPTITVQGGAGSGRERELAEAIADALENQTSPRLVAAVSDQVRAARS